MSDNKEIKILWTGGWDSTFQVLQLLISDKIHVRPYYLIDEERLSTREELFTIKEIKKKLFREFPYTKNLLYPVNYHSISDLKIDKQISESFEDIRNKKFIGSQYEWLAAFCHEHNLENLQLCIHRDDKAHHVIEHMVSEECFNGNKVLKIEDYWGGSNEYELFKYFNFPVFNLTKPDMAEIIERQNLNDLMNITWFCHKPIKGMQPCGTCNPCTYTIEEGLGWRIPSKRAYLAKIKRTIKKFKNL